MLQTLLPLKKYEEEMSDEESLLKLFLLMFCLCWNSYEWLLQFESATIIILIRSPLGNNNPV